MNHKKTDILTVVLFCGFLFTMLLGYLLLPKKDFSETEKRHLMDTPALSWTDVASGDWGNDAETYMADHIPGRNFFVGLNAYFDLFTGRQVGKDIHLVSDRLVEAPVVLDEAIIRKNMTAINTLAENLGRKVDLMIVPSAGWALNPENYLDSNMIDTI